MRPDEPSSGSTTATPPPTPSPDNPAPENLPLGYYSSLSLEPSSSTPKQPQPQVTLEPTAEVPQKKKHPIRLVILILLAIVVVFMGISVFVYLRSKITVADLVTENTDGTTYVRPRQWKAVQAGNVSGYGDKRAKDGKSTAAVVMAKTVGDTISSIGSDNGEAYYSRLRQLYVDELPVEALVPYFEFMPEKCDSKNITLTKEVDTTSTPTTIGLLKVSATCKQSKTAYTVKLRGIVGRDGYIRLICVVAPERDWKQSAEAFQKMLDSLAQAE